MKTGSISGVSCRTNGHGMRRLKAPRDRQISKRQLDKTNGIARSHQTDVWQRRKDN